MRFESPPAAAAAAESEWNFLRRGPFMLCAKWSRSRARRVELRVLLLSNWCSDCDTPDLSHARYNCCAKRMAAFNLHFAPATRAHACSNESILASLFIAYYGIESVWTCVRKNWDLNWMEKISCFCSMHNWNFLYIRKMKYLIFLSYLAAIFTR